MSEWLEGPPLTPGMYWYQLQGSGMIRSCEVIAATIDYQNGIKTGEMIMAAHNIGDGPMRASRPFRRWMHAGEEKPAADHTWLDPRYKVRKRS